MPAATINHARHLSVTVVRDDKPVGYRVLDMRTDYPPLLTELAWRSLAAEPSAGGSAWVPSVRIDARDPSSPQVILEARLADDDNKSAGADPLAAVEVPASTFHWIAASIANAVGVTGACSYVLAVQEPDSPLVADWRDSARDSDVEFLTQAEPGLTLPERFEVAAPPGPRRVVDETGTWLRCLFRQGTFDSFLAMAGRETEREHAWLGVGHVCPTRESCCVVIEPELVELPGEAGRAWVFTRGREWAKLYARLGDRIAAFLHLHPAALDGEELSPTPSENDAAVAWNLSLASRNPLVFPIAMFGASADSPQGAVAAYGYERGLLRRIQLEVFS
jgi:hypothetical protein